MWRISRWGIDMYERCMVAICKVRLSARPGISMNTCKLTSFSSINTCPRCGYWEDWHSPGSRVYLELGPWNCKNEGCHGTFARVFEWACVRLNFTIDKRGSERYLAVRRGMWWLEGIYCPPILKVLTLISTSSEIRILQSVWRTIEFAMNLIGEFSSKQYMYGNFKKL